MIRQHAILSWSGAHIWLKCAPSARFQEQIPEENSIYSEEGTLAHDLGALFLNYYIGAFAGREDNFTNEYNAKYLEVYNWYINNYPQEDPKGLSDAMCEHAQGYALFVFSIGGVILVEETLDLSRFAPLSWGTGDGLNFFPDVIYVNDFKYGAGKRVYAERNDQLMGYALGAYLRAVEKGFDPHTVVMNIIQPRMSLEPSSAQISVTDLLEWAANVVAPMAKLAIAGQGAFVPGEEQCQFCRARTRCAAFYDKFGECWNLQDGRVITAEQRAFVLTYGDALIKYIKAMQGDAVKRLKAREAIPGFKLVGTLADRRFTDEAAVVQILTNMGYEAEHIYKPSAIKGITELEALLKKKTFNEVLGPYIIRPEGNPKLVPETHASPALGAAAADLYDAPDYSQN